MAKGYDQNQERLAAMNLLGKDLARRAKSKCELCEEGGQKLSPYEVPPVPAQPDLERALLICEECAEQLGSEKKFRVDDRWRFLCSTIWSEMPAVQVVSMRLLRRLADEKKTATWAQEALDGAFLAPEVEEWAETL